MASESKKRVFPEPGEILADIKFWLVSRGPWWATSVVAHAVILSAVMLTIKVAAPRVFSEAPAFEAATIDTEIKPPDDVQADFDLSEVPYDPSELNTDTLLVTEYTAGDIDEQMNGSPDDSFSEAGGGLANAVSDFGGFSGMEIKAMGPGPKLTGEGGLSGKGAGNNAGSGGAGVGIGGRGAGMRKGMVGRGGGTRATEIAVNAALHWLSRHQNPDGSWSLDRFHQHCRGGECTGRSEVKSDSAATAMALLPFLAAGQTHKTKGPYQQHIGRGLAWLIQHQAKDGSLAHETGHVMYTHGLAAICMCEAYALSEDPVVGESAQKAIRFIESAQDPNGGGWRYAPKEPGDTSVVGWQVMALKSGLMAGLRVSEPTIPAANKFLKSVASGKSGGLYAYLPGEDGRPSMTAVGLLCAQYLGAHRDDPGIQEGTANLMANLPNEKQKNIYYWYYATQVMHNLPGEQWDTWNRQMRRVLIDTQDKEGCAKGSWDPKEHGFGDQGGRIFVTSLSALTLEIYYRYLPLYKTDESNPLKAAAR